MFGSTLKRFSPTAVALAGLVLAFAVLGPSAAVGRRHAPPGRRRRRARHRLGHRCVRDRRGRDQVAPREGDRPLHRGRHPTGADTISLSGSSVEVAANGDRLYATLSGSATLDAAFNGQGTVVNTFTGGTGRFENASGVEKGSFSMATRSLQGGRLTSAISVSLAGTISY